MLCLFRCPGSVTNSRVFSTETVDYVLLYENLVFYYNKSLDEFMTSVAAAWGTGAQVNLTGWVLMV